MADDTYGNAVVVTATFKGPDRLRNAEKLERWAKRVDPHVGLFTEQVEVEGVERER